MVHCGCVGFFRTSVYAVQACPLTHGGSSYGILGADEKYRLIGRNVRFERGAQALNEVIDLLIAENLAVTNR